MGLLLRNRALAMRYAHYSDNGIILGFYDDGFHTAIPEPNILISIVNGTNAFSNTLV